MAGSKSFRSLWNVLEGRSALRDPTQISGELKAYALQLLQGNGIYAEISAESTAKFKAKTNVKSSKKQFILKLSKFLGLGEEQTLDLFKKYLMDEYRGSRSELQAVIANERYGDALMVKIMEYYFEERLTVYRCLKHLFVYWQDARHPYRTEYKEFVESQLVDKEHRFVKQLMAQNKASYLQRAPTSEKHGETMTSHLSSRWAVQLLKEQAGLLEVLLLYYRDFYMPAERLIGFARLFQAQLFGARQLNKYLFDGSANELINYIGSLQMLVVIEGLDIDWILGSLKPNSLAQHHVVQAGDCCQELDQLFSGWGDLPHHGPILLSWAMLRLLTGDSTAAKFSKKIGARALQNGAIQQLLTTLQLNHVKTDSALCLTVKSVIHILVSVIVTTFDESALGDSADLTSVLTETLAAKHLCKSFWTTGVRSGLGSVLISSQARFPFQFSSFVRLLTSLSSHVSGAYNVVEYLKSLSLFSQPFNESCPGDDIDITGDEQVWQVTVPRVVCRSALSELPNIVIPAGVFGRVDSTDSGQQMIVWEFPYSGWHLFLLEMDALLHAVNLGSDIDSLPVVGRVTAICSLLHQILSSDYSLIESLNPVLQRVYAILQKFSSSHNPAGKLLEACLRCITAVAKIKPKQAWLCLQQTGYLPHTSASSMSQRMDISPSNFGHILSIRERPSGQHPITLATLDLLATLVKGLSSPVDDDCLGECPVDLAASVLFVVHDIFSSFHRWRYVDIKDRDILGHMSLEIFQLALTHGKPKQEGHTSLSELLTRALLYSEAGQALLNIIATGVDAIDLFLTLQTSESESRGFNLVLLIKKAFQVVTQLLRSTGEEVSVVEQALSSLMVDRPSLGMLHCSNGGSVHIVSVIASYIHHRQDPELPTLSTQLFKSLCLVSPMSMYGCLGSEEDSNSIRDGYVLRLNARTEDVGLKISILDFLASAVKTQPGLTEHFLDLKRVSCESTDGQDSEKFDMGRNSCLSAVLSLVTNNPETLPLELLCAVFGFLESLWKNRKDAALAAIRLRDRFWESAVSPLSTDLPQKATDDHYRVVSCALQIVALEVFYVAEGKLDNNLCDVLKEFTQDNRFEYWTEVLKPEDSSLVVEVSDKCRLHFLRSWQMFVLVAVNCQPSEVGLNSARMKRSLLECILRTLHAQVSSIASPYSIAACEELASLFSCILRNWIETVANALDTLTEIVKILDCAQNKDLRISTAIEKAAFSACIILLQQLQTPTEETKWLPAVQLLRIVTLSLQQASFMDSSRPLKDMVVHVFLIEVLVKYLPAPVLWMPVLTENSSLLLLIQVLDCSLKSRTDVEFADAVLHMFLSISTSAEVAGSLTLLGVHQSLCLSLQRDDLPHNSTMSQLALINSNHKPSWTRVWHLSLALVTTLMQTLGRDFLNCGLDFVGVHHEQLAKSLEAVQSNQSLMSLDEAERSTAVLAQLARFHQEWRFSLPPVFDSLKQQVGWLCQACSSLLSRPQLLSHLVDLASERFSSHHPSSDEKEKRGIPVGVSTGKHVHFDSPGPQRRRGVSQSSTSSSDGQALASPLFIKIQGKLLSVLAHCLTVMRHIAPSLVAVINDTAFDLDEYLPQLRLAFNAPALENIEMPSFGSLLAALNACVAILPKPHRTATPTKSPSGGSSSLPELSQDRFINLLNALGPFFEQIRSLLMFVIENCLRLVLTEAAIYLRNSTVDPRVKRLLKRELGSELSTCLSSLARQFTRRSGTPVSLGKKSPALDRSHMVAGAGFSRDDKEQKFFYLADMFVRQLLR